jgi:hypothetical protein
MASGMWIQVKDKDLSREAGAKQRRKKRRPPANSVGGGGRATGHPRRTGNVNG